MKLRSAIIVKCNGRAHTPDGAYQDNCMVCLPYWNEYPTCPEPGCGRKLRNSRTLKNVKEGPVANCPEHGRFVIS